MRIGIDMGGTKIEAIALDDGGRQLGRYRVPTPRHDLEGSVRAIVGLVERLETETGMHASVGVGMPGALSPLTGKVKNANSTWLIGQPFDHMLGDALGRPVRCVNDANCLAVSEATDGAAAGAAVVFGVIIGTGTGAGIALNGRAHVGANAIGGEWGHNSLPWPEADELPGPDCYCGKKGCIETWVSGTGLCGDFFRATGRSLTGREIVAATESDADAQAALQRYENRLARSLAQVVNVLDPDVIVLGGGVSNVDRIYENVPRLMSRWIFGAEFNTPIRQAVHGDSSGVRGAAWLWSIGEYERLRAGT